MSNQLTTVDAFRTTLTKMGAQFKMVLPAHIPEERFVRTVMTAVQQNTKLLECDRNSLLGACLKAAQDGLLPDSREGAIVSFNTKNGPMAQWLPMVAGILKKVRNSKELISISSKVVYEKDTFEYWIDSHGEHLKHVPYLEGEPGSAVLTYAIARTKDDGIYIEVMTEHQMQAVRDCSRAKDFGPWVGPFADEMRRKTAIRRLSKRLPMSTDLESVVEADDSLYDFGAVHPKKEQDTPELKSIESSPAPKTKKKTRLEQLVVDEPKQIKESELL